MARHTTFKFCLDPTVEQEAMLVRHIGAARFAFNQSLRMVKVALNQRRRDPECRVPWTPFDLINAFNSWKRSADAGRVFCVDGAGAAEVVETGLTWRNQVCQQVFEEAAVDCARALRAWSDSRRGKTARPEIQLPALQEKESRHRLLPAA